MQSLDLKIRPSKYCPVYKTRDGPRFSTKLRPHPTTYHQLLARRRLPLATCTAAAAATATELPMCEYSAIEFTLSPALFTNLYVACVFRDVFELFGSINLLERLRLNLYYNVVFCVMSASVATVHQRHRCRAYDLAKTIEINLSPNVQSLRIFGCKRMPTSITCTALAQRTALFIYLFIQSLRYNKIIIMYVFYILQAPCQPIDTLRMRGTTRSYSDLNQSSSDHRIAIGNIIYHLV